MSEWTKLKTGAVAISVLAAVTLTSIAVVTGFKNTGNVSNTTADYFITAVTIFGSFAGVLVLALMGKVIIKMFSSK